MFKDIKISHKLIIIVMIPIIGLVYFTIASTLEKQNIVDNMNLLQALSELAVKSSSLVHELQKERGISAGFIGSQGTKFSHRLRMQRPKTDYAIKKLDRFITNFNFKPFNYEIKDDLDSVFARLKLIETKRNLINELNISLEEELQYYSQIIISLLTEINELSKITTKSELYNMLVAYVNILQVKEKAGIERATLNNVFIQGHFAPGVYRKSILLAGVQDNYIKHFLFFATPHQRKIYHNIVQGDFVNEVERIRKIAFKKASKFRILANLHAHLGYNGLIHQLSNYILWGETKYIDVFYQKYENAYMILNIYKNLPYISSHDLKNIEIIENTFDTYNQYLTKAIKLKKQQKTVDEIDAIIKIDDADAIQALNNLLNDGYLEIEPTYWWKMATGKINLFKAIEDQISYDLKASAQALKKEAQNTFIFYLIITGITIILTLFLSYISIRSITKPLKTLVNVANQISSGNRNINIQVHSKDETGELSSAMSHMLTSINRSEDMLKKTNQAYARFMPNEILQLLNKDNIIDTQLGNHLEMNMTVLFSDIRAFTALSEKMSPQENFNFMNAYLKAMGPIIREHNGLIDKYIGDAIMALFINTDDALKAAIAMLNKLSEFNQTLQRQNLPSINIGIGLNTGQLMLGIIGEQNRLQGTVISDAVNVAARIESLTKIYQESLIIGENTFINLTEQAQYAIRFLDNIKVKGRTERINIFAVFNADPKPIREGKFATLNTFEEAVQSYQLQKFNQVKKLMQICLHQNPHDTLPELYLQRCQNFLAVKESEFWEEIASIIECTSELSIGNSFIDKQHKELRLRLKNLVMSIGSGETEEELNEMINFLEHYASSHFKTEEKYMKQYHYPNYAIHKTQHREFIEHLNKIKTDYKRAGGHLSLVLQIQQNIIYWLTHHITQLDKKLVLFLNDRENLS